MATFSTPGASSTRHTLPTWITTELGAGKLGIECPYKDCGGKAVVNKRKWLRMRKEFIGRSCTYCFKTNAVPEEMR